MIRKEGKKKEKEKKEIAVLTTRNKNKKRIINFIVEEVNQYYIFRGK